VFQRQWWVGLGAAVAIAILLLVSVLLTAWPAAVTDLLPADVRAVAALLFDEYLFPLQVVGLLLLAAVIGGLYLARRDEEMPETNVTRVVLPGEGRSE
jgi:NADH-quinone oxidoreductase subunit J